jgi:uncharacterized membrane protein
MNSETRSNEQSIPNKQLGNKIAWLFLFVSLAGFLDSTYLAAKHYVGGIVPCTFGNCEQVLNSSYSVFFGIPVALFGAIYYLSVLGLVILYFDVKKEKILVFSSYLTVLGLAASAYFVFIQLFVIGAICEFCMVSAATSSVLFGFGVWFLVKTRRGRV